MSGLLILISCWVASGEILPAPKNATVSVSSERTGQSTSERLPPPKSVASSSPAKLVTTTTEATLASLDQIGAETCKIGWGTDKSDGTMYMVVQIAPEAIAAFAAGDRGQELPCDVPPGLRSRISKVIVRIGNGTVERDPPESELAMLPLPTNPNSNARIATLDLKSQTPVNVDSPRSSSSIVSTASTSQLPGVTGTIPSATGEVFPGNSPPVIVSNPIVSNPVVPSTSIPGSAPPLTSSPTAYNATGGTLGTYSSAGAATNSPAWNNNTPSLPSTTTYSNDGFAPPKTVPTTLNPFGSARTNTPLPSTSSTQGNVTYNGTNGAAAPPAGYSNTYGNVPLVANNGAPGVYPPGNNGLVLPNDPNGYHAANGGTHPMTNPGFNGNYAATQPNYTSQPFNGQQFNGQPFNGQQQPMTNPVLPIPQLANRPLPSTSGNTITNASLPSGYLTGNRDEQLQSDRNGTINAKAGSLVPFFLVLSFILNVYFGLWLNHLSIKYRHLLGSLRGLTPAEMDR